MRSNLEMDRQRVCERIVECANEAVLFFECRSRIRLWDEAPQEIFGYTKALVDTAVDAAANVVTFRPFDSKELMETGNE